MVEKVIKESEYCKNCSQWNTLSSDNSYGYCMYLGGIRVNSDDSCAKVAKKLSDLRYSLIDSIGNFMKGYTL